MKLKPTNKSLTEYHINLLCIYNPNFAYWEYWDYELTEYQINLLCAFNPNFTG